ncbi:exocyst complex component 7-like isoform X1 [Eriocheir sinensis]|uniref:exocyst complex component 7-like isoform X1 n=1 Tax=Eriocheir sinensis TaxID=95602 RepID=UPI0021C9CD57|nr:exocyst complex component 7-like isoform X1 [Eriocheir sinensis]
MIEQNLEKKLAVTRKLEKEISQLSNVREVLSRSGQVATSVGSILDSFEHRLARLETTILPLYQQTGNLQRRQLNTEKTLQELDHVISFYNVAGQVEGVVKERPSSVGVPQYLQAMDRLAETCRYFEQNKPQSVEIENVTSLFEVGTDALSKEFRDELKKYQKAVPPMVTLELLEEEEINEETLSGVELVPPGVREDLRAIAAWLDKHNNTDRLTVYAKLRSDALSQSLKALRDYQRSSSIERGQTTGSLNSPGPPRSRLAKMDSTSKSRTQKISNRANRMLKKAITGHVSSRRPGSPGNASYSLHGTLTPPHGAIVGGVGEEGLEDTEVELYLNQVSALHCLAFAEYLLAQQLVPDDRVTRTFEMILKDPMDQLVTEGEGLAAQARRSVSRGDYQAVLSVLAMLRHVTNVQPEYDRLLTNCQTSIRSKFAAIINMLQDTCVKALEGFVDSVKSDGERALPKDGTVHQLTSNALIFTEQLLDYAPTLAPILQRDTTLINALSNLPRNIDQFLQAKALLGAYVKRVLVNLGLALVSRSETYSDTTLRAIFRLNNYNYILKTLLSSELLNLVALVEPQCDKMYNDQIMEQKRLYSQSWSRVLHYLVNHEDVPLSVIQAGKLRDKDRQLIKEKFAGFNKEMEEMSRVQRSYSIPDRELRESLKRDNMEYILPKYQAFYDKYFKVAFTKNTEKYIKYSPADVSNMVDKFFDVAA